MQKITKFWVIYVGRFCTNSHEFKFVILQTITALQKQIPCNKSFNNSLLDWNQRENSGCPFSLLLQDILLKSCKHFKLQEKNRAIFFNFTDQFLVSKTKSYKSTIVFFYLSFSRELGTLSIELTQISVDLLRAPQDRCKKQSVEYQN